MLKLLFGSCGSVTAAAVGGGSGIVAVDVGIDVDIVV